MSDSIEQGETSHASTGMADETLATDTLTNTPRHFPPGVLYDPKLVRWERDWRDAGRRPGDTRKRGVIAFLRDNLFAPRP